MIYSLTGKILKKTLDTVVISCAGVGYAVQVPLTTAESLPAPGREGTVYTVMNVTENDVSLYTFAYFLCKSCTKSLYTSGFVSFSASINSSSTRQTCPASALITVSKSSLIL